ncbi:hypothetical protein FOA43_003430 [Brettanomyces nanus]|uniref:Uncharacterized protein n=1 Tax=Eeniella nana TaxID=13502 RepID=A0A875SAQ5_EENNA|nr:uncharacterized protein FOA43_003430 [Brettanomyces nanus]QPG76044.1 hypothetical protein FOA43_003430 [Brettanomyces nanus]
MSDITWKDAVLRRWYYQDFSPICISSLPGRGYYELARVRCLKDKEINYLIDTIIRKAKTKMTLKLIEAMFDESEDSWMYIPELIRIRNHLQVGNLNLHRSDCLYARTFRKAKEDNLRVRLASLNRVYVASVLLEAIQLKALFKLFVRVLYMKIPSSEVERLLVHLNLLDSNYFELLHCREVVLERAVQYYCCREKEHLTQNENTKLITEALMDTLHNGQNVSFARDTEDTKLDFEDLLILRNYGCDSKLASFNAYAMVQEIGRRLEVSIPINHMCINPTSDADHLLMVYSDHQFNAKPISRFPAIYRQIEKPCKYLEYVLNFMFGADFDRTIFRSRGIWHPQSTSCEGECGHGVTENVVGTSFVRDSTQRIVQLFLQFITLKRIAALQSLVEYISKKRTPILLMMLRSVLRGFQGKENYHEEIAYIDEKLNDTCQLALDVDIKFAFGTTYDRSLWDDNVPHGLHVGDVIFSYKQEAGVIVAYREENKSKSFLCLMSKSFLQVVNARDICVREFTDELVLEFAEYDQLGEFFSGFDWIARRFVV